MYICYIYMYSILPFLFCLHGIKLTGWSMRRMCLPSTHPQLRFFVCFLCFSVNGVRISLVFEEKAIFLGKQGGLKDYICSEEIDFVFIFSRLVSLWALYTLKWTLVTLVLMGHYLTYKSLRHNQLHFTSTDPLSNGRLPLLPAPPQPSRVSW